jgi:hypothetical protein
MRGTLIDAARIFFDDILRSDAQGDLFTSFGDHWIFEVHEFSLCH